MWLQKCPCKLWPASWTLQYRMGKLGLPRDVYIRERGDKGGEWGVPFTKLDIISLGLLRLPWGKTYPNLERRRTVV